MDDIKKFFQNILDYCIEQKLFEINQAIFYLFSKMIYSLILYLNIKSSKNVYARYILLEIAMIHFGLILFSWGAAIPFFLKFF